MNKTLVAAVARRYAPLAVALGVLLGVIIVVPSKAPRATISASANGSGYVSPYAGTGGTVPAPGQASGSLTGGLPGAAPATGGAAGAPTAPPAAGTAPNAVPSGTVPGAVPGVVGPGNPAGAARQPGAAPAPGPTGKSGQSRPGGRPSAGATSGTGVRSGGGAAAAGHPAPGDTGHCVAGRQFDPAIDFYAPPCVPTFAGDNGGATSSGVTATTITVVLLQPKPNPALEQINRGAGRSNADELALNNGLVDFVNKRFELYGRQVKLVPFTSTCDGQPPNLPCMRNEANQVTQDLHPFAVLSLGEAPTDEFDQFSKDGVINLGGLDFSSAFDKAHAPYHWDITMNLTDVAEHSAELWCSTLNGHKAQYAGSASLQAATRNLGVVNIDNPDTKAAVDFLDQRMKALCGASVTHRFSYAADPSTAEQQRTAAVQAMQTGTPATTVLCFCDPISPVLLFTEMRQENYFPEEVLNGYGIEDYDPAAQTYGADCGGATAVNGCAFANTFIISPDEGGESIANGKGVRMYHAGGHADTPTLASINIYGDYWELIGTMLQSAGPRLTPGNVDTGMHQLPGRGGGADTLHPLRAFPPGSYEWLQDMRIAYWSTTQASPANGSAGTFVTVGSRRYQFGQYPADLALPAKPR